MIQINEVPQVALECLHQDHIDVSTMVNQLMDELDQPTDSKMLTDHFNTLVEHCVNHFCCEEKQLTSFHYPNLDTHKAEHEWGIAIISNAQERWLATFDRARLKHYLANIFSPWLIDHIQSFDVDGSQFIYNAGGR